MSLTTTFLDELRARTTLSTLIGRTVKVTKAGREFKACCPFHNEKSPSFTINDEKGFYHCLAGETKVITSDGRSEIANLAGTTVNILSRGGQWISAHFKAYGEQKLWKISLSRNRVTKEIFATSGHRWFVRDRKTEATTIDLRAGHRLEAALPLKRTDWTLDAQGVRHGIIFGDGTMYKGVYGTINLHGEKDVELRKWFPAQDHHVQEREGGKLYLRIYGGRAFENMKDLPKNGASEAYLLGFLAGYLAADGHVAKDGTVMLNSANPETLEVLRDICTSLGIITYGRTTLLRKGYGAENSALHRIHFAPSSLSEQLFLLNAAKVRFAANTKKFERLRWVVQSVEPTNRLETVYCAEVPVEHAFALDDNILTGNCFGCGAHGDAIRWMTDQRGLPFMDAVKELAANAGIEVPAADPRAAERAERANSLYDIMTAAADWFTEQLGSIAGSEARAYLEQRGLNAATIKAFGIGFAPDARGKLRTALAKFGDAALIEAGLLISVDDKEPYDRFRGRLMIPIRDPRGRVIAFGGRILGAGEPKYLNSPDTPLFDKGRTLYNLDRAAAAARKSGRVIVVEGYMDVIALAQAGYEESVAPLGTALTEDQIARLWRVSDCPIICFDGDSAGQKAALRAINRALPYLEPGKSLQFVTLPAKLDPDDVVRKQGKAAFDGFLADAKPLDQFLWSAEQFAEPLVTPEARAGFGKRLRDHARMIRDEDVRTQYLAVFSQRLREFFTPNITSGRKFFSEKRGFVPPSAALTGGVAALGIDQATIIPAIFSALTRHPHLITRHAESIGRLAIGSRDMRQFRQLLFDAALSGPAIDIEIFAQTVHSEGLGPVWNALNKSNGIAFSFLRADTEPAKAETDLAAVIEKLAASTEIKDQLAQLEEQLKSTENWTDAGFDEQARLRAAEFSAMEQLKALLHGDDET